MKYLYLSLISFVYINAFAQGEQTYNDYNSRSELNPQLAPFYHGVASGDPLTDRVIIWTRITVDNPGSIDVNWRFGTDTLFNNVVASGTVTTDETKDYTIKVDVTGLQPGTWYYYEFNSNGRNSLIGRTKTLPVGDVDSLRFALASCADYQNGYYNAYKHIGLRNDIDAVIFVGDYIYEYAASSSVGREHEPANEIISLYDYRTRYSQYHLDPDLRYVHQQYPFIAVWDDHEIANNTWHDGAENHTPGTEGNWADRAAAAHEAYNEWLPIRLPEPGNNDKIFRTFRYGDLLNLYMLDTRYYARDEQGSGTDATRELVGTEQMDWLTNQMDTSNVLWNVIGQQVMVAPLTIFNIPVNNDQWDGYPADRDTLYQRIQDKGVENIVVLTGDIHTSWANDLPLSNYNNSNVNAITGSVGVEYVGTSITSQSSPLGVGIGIIQAANPHIRWADLTQKGYILMDINKTRTQGDWYFVNTIASQNFTTSVGASWYVNEGETFLRQTQNASQSPLILQPQAPLLPNNPVSVGDNTPPAALIGVYPNPFVDRIILQFNLFKPEAVLLEIYDNAGKTVYSKNLGKVRDGLSYFEISDLNLSPGAYHLAMKVADQQLNKILVKTQ